MMSTKKERIGWYFYDWANSAFSTTVVTVFIGPYLTIIAKSAADSAGNISILGIPIFHGSYFAYVISLSVILQVIFLPLFGAIADQSNSKKQFLLFFTYLGSLATISLFFLKDNHYLFGGFLFLLSNFCFGSSAVMYNAFLGELAEKDEQDTVSSIGWAFGYVGGGIALALNLILFSNSNYLNITPEFAIRICLSSAGIWWAMFSLIPALTLKIRKREKPLLNTEDDAELNKKNKDWIITGSIKKLTSTLKDAKNYPITVMFLVAYLFYNDGVQAIISVSSQFGAQEFKLSMGTLTKIILMVQFVAFGGSLLFNFIAKKIKTKNAILFSLFVWLFVIIYAYGLLKTEFDFWLMASIIAVVLGGTQALSRSMYSRLIPVGSEAEYFSLYEVSERGTSWMGPLIFGLSLQLTHSYRIAMLSLGIFFIVGIILLWRIKKYL